MKVSGIGPKVYENIKDSITVSVNAVLSKERVRLTSYRQCRVSCQNRARCPGAGFYAIYSHQHPTYWWVFPVR